MAESPICKRLKEARLAAGLSQKKLGIAAGMDEFSASSRMNHYEIDRHQPDFETLKRIGKVLKVPVAYFYAENDDIAVVITLFYKMNKVEKARFLKSIHME
ncbi:MAG: helix-turn-helix transcriptional regulator [Gammaproteobacteria bacterium]